jgi:hypothetical protein
MLLEELAKDAEAKGIVVPNDGSPEWEKFLWEAGYDAGFDVGQKNPPQRYSGPSNTDDLAAIKESIQKLRETAEKQSACMTEIAIILCKLVGEGKDGVTPC